MNSAACERLKLPGAYLAAMLALVLQFAAATAWAQLPELPQPSALSGTPTTAKFYAGATTDDGASYKVSFSADSLLDVLAEIRVEPGHVNSSGNLYLILLLDGQFFMRIEAGDFVEWDGALESLQATTVAKTLQFNELLTVVQDTAFGPLGLGGSAIEVYLAYDTVTAPGELYFSGTPLSFVIDTAADLPSFSFYVENISSAIIQARCIVCHSSTGIASGSSLIYLDSSALDYQRSNYDSLIQYIENVPNGSELILSKPQGLSAHGGGVQLTAADDELQAWSEFVVLSVADIASSGNGQNNESIFSPVVKMDGQQTLRKAALLFAGRLPTTIELDNVASASDDELRMAIRELMQGDGFREFLTESANDRLLTEAFAFNLFGIVDRYYYPSSLQYYQSGASYRAERLLISAALAREPLELIAQVVTNERPYTEILTADYIMVNPYSALIYGGDVVFDDSSDADEWKQGRITEYYRCSICARGNDIARYDISTEYPHAGILNSPAFLSRFPSTSTNRNRARARWAYYFFLGVDIEGLSARTTDPAALSDENNPTLNNSNCTVCHNIMDPVAGVFQNYSDDGYYRNQPGGDNSLPRSYRNDPQGLYQIGDTWYPDMLAPGFGEKLAPDADNSLQWLAQEFINDSRFGYGTVNFWYPAVMGRKPYAEPKNPEDADYLSRLAAYTTESELMQSVADNFVAGGAGNGVHNLKDLLVDLVVSDHFRAASAENLTAAQEIELDAVGTGKLLTPEQLNRKLLDATGFDWKYGRFGALDQVYSLIYGGIDSFGVTDRATELTTLMSSVVSAMANEVSCPIVSNDFSINALQRKLFKEVELTTLPTTDAAAIRSNIQYLHSRLLGEDLASDDVEIDATVSLFEAVWNARLAANKGAAVSSVSELCIFENVDNPVEIDANQTLRSWAAVINYLLRDYKFIHE